MTSQMRNQAFLNSTLSVESEAYEPPHKECLTSIQVCTNVPNMDVSLHMLTSYYWTTSEMLHHPGVSLSE